MIPNIKLVFLCDLKSMVSSTARYYMFFKKDFRKCFTIEIMRVFQIC